MRPFLLLLLLAANGCDSPLGDGGPSGQWWFRLHRTETCDLDKTAEYAVAASVDPIDVAGPRVHIKFGNQEWTVSVVRGVNCGGWQELPGATVLFECRFSGDYFEGALVFDAYLDGCKNAYRITGQKLIDYPGY